MTTSDSDGARVRTMLRMRARAGCEAAFTAAWEAAAAEISNIPGNLRQDLIQDANDPRTFLIVSDWNDQAALEEFGRSSARDQLTAALRDLRESAEKSTYQVLRTVTAHSPRIRVLVTITVAPGQEEAYERAYRKVAERMRGTPGHIREELLREPGTSTYHLFAEWENEEIFNAWADNPAHLEQTAPLLPYILESFQRTTYHLIARPDEGWFGDSPPSTQAPSRPSATVASTPVATTPVPTAKPVATPADAASSVSQPTAATRTHREGSPVEFSPDVLIVGAGPAGLTAAIELARRGVGCRIIEKRPELSGTADKAIGIQCRTMEIWEDMGVVREAMDAGIWLHGQTVFVNGRQTHQVDWDLPELPFAHLGLPQYETERILTNRLAELGVQVERGCELVDFTQDDSGVTANLLHASGAAETVRVQYLVGSDGAHSTVRERLGLTFEGGMGMFPQLFMLGDVDLDWSMPEGHLLRFIQVEDEEMKGMLVCVPLRGQGRYRVATLAPAHLQGEIGVGPIPPGFSKEYTPPTLADIQDVVDQLAPAGTTASNMRWSSIFRIKHGIVDRYQVGRVFVAGDAAHLHPPAGGQGMNTGIQDAWNLGWKLALAVQGKGAPNLLESYEQERRPAGKSIVDRAVRIAFTDEMDMDDEKEQFMLEMQMSMTYAGSPLVDESLDNAGMLSAGPQPGDRAPDAQGLRRFGVSHPVRLFDLTRGTAHTLVFYADSSTDSGEMFEFEKLTTRLRSQYPNLINVYVLASPDASVPEQLDLPLLRDAEGAFRAAYGAGGTCAYLVRPDGHVGLRTAPVSSVALDRHLAKVFAF